MAGSELQPGTLPSEQVPTPQIVAQSAPGKRGPTGLSPRTNYSRANTSPAPAGDGAAEFKALEPPKLAGDNMRSFNQGFSVHQLLEQVTLDSLSSVKLAEEARNQDKTDKKKKEEPKDDCDMEHAGKTAAALEELADMFDKLADSHASNTDGGNGSVRTAPTMTGKPSPASHPSSQGSAAHQAPHGKPDERAHPSETATAMATVDVTQAMAGPSPKMAGLFTQSPLFLAKEADLSDARKAELRSMGHDKAKGTKDIFDRLRGVREQAKVPHSDASVVMKNGRNAGEALARTATGGSGASITKNMGHLATAPKGSKKGLLAAGAALAAGGAAAVGKHMHDKAKLDKLRKGVAAGVAGAAAAGGAAAAANSARKKEAAETSPKVVDVLASTPPPGGPSHLLSSNESATNFSRGDAYKNRVAELNKMLDERVGGAGDTTLRQVLSTTGEADPKMAAAQKTAAQVLFNKMQANGAGTLLGLLGGVQ